MLKEFVIQMKENYPFGELSGFITQETNVLVKKTLHYQNEEQFEMINSMVHFIKIAKHQRLVNINKVLQGQSRIELFYEYAPLKLERWLISVNEAIIKQLQIQLLELAKYLTRSSIKFQFDPLSIGLGQDLSIKYFLNKFSIDMENQQENYAEIRQEIEEYFKTLQKKWKQEQLQEKNQEDTSIKISVIDSMSTTGSISNIEELIFLSKEIDGYREKRLPKTPQKYGIKTQLSQKVESSKRKCLEVMDRFKRIVQR